jgi:hypothetical protein
VYVGHGGRWVWTRAPGWTAAHLDVVRVGALVIAAIVALLLSSWTSLLIVVVVLAAFEVGVTLLSRSLTPSDASLPPSEA